ncbi:Translation factor guf1 mitochondrial [Apiospora marii]|uniref:Translation factor guf1 mitochondrial n=1 Tax=Apiospora marii TaxID=335849 RepID=A0ABR1RJS7_9PEZI
MSFIIKYRLPTAQLVDGLFGKLKGVTKGYATLNYEDTGSKRSSLVKLHLAPVAQRSDCSHVVPGGVAPLLRTLYNKLSDAEIVHLSTPFHHLSLLAADATTCHRSLSTSIRPRTAVLLARRLWSR